MRAFIRRGVAFHKYPNGGLLRDIPRGMIFQLNLPAAEVVEKVIARESNIIKWFMERFSVDYATAKNEVYTLLNILKKENFLTDKSSESVTLSPTQSTPSLSRVTLRVTDHCNLKCIHCFLGDNRINHFLPISSIEKLFSVFHEYRVMTVLITGGEPLSHPQILEILKLANRYALPFRLSTNATLLNENILRELMTMPYFHSIVLSIEGLNEDHDKIRGVGNFELLLDVMKKLRRHAIRFSINITINKLNFNYLEDLVNFGLNQGAYTVHLTPIYPEGRAEGSLLLLSKEDLLKVFQKMAEIKKNPRILLGPVDIPASYEMEEKGIGICNLGKEWCIVYSDGSVVPCRQFYNEGFIAGNILQQDFSSIWKHAELFKKLREIHPEDIEACRGCKIIRYCRGGCRFRAYKRDNTFYGSDDKMMCDLRREYFYIGLIE